MTTDKKMDFNFEMRTGGKRDAQPGMVWNARTGHGFFTVSTVFAAEIVKRWNAYPKLEALEKYGVDNWCGYDEAMRELRNNDI